MNKFSTYVSLAVLCCSFLTAEGQALSPRNVPASGAKAAPPAPDGKLGMGILGARVSSDATISIAAGATSANKLGTGTYEVSFVRDVSLCIYSAASYDNSSPIFVEPRSGNPNGVFIEFETDAGALVDSQFYLTVFCPK